MCIRDSHQAMDVIAIHQRSQFSFLALAAQHKSLVCGKAVSYTHLDVYKRQVEYLLSE